MKVEISYIMSFSTSVEDIPKTDPALEEKSAK